MRDSLLVNVLAAHSLANLLPEAVATLEAAVLLAQEQLHLFTTDEAFTEKVALALGDGADLSELRLAWQIPELARLVEIVESSFEVLRNSSSNCDATLGCMSAAPESANRTRWNA